jgi:hypothetical protein
MQMANLITGINHCFIVDEVGMASTFPQIKYQLTAQGNHHVTIICTSLDNHFSFKKELNILEKMFPLQFIVFYEMIAEPATSIAQENIEAILNSNVMDEITFTISGNEAFIAHIAEELHFLGINQINIQEQLFI